MGFRDFVTCRSFSENGLGQRYEKLRAKTYAIAMENIAVAKANASASLEVAQVAAAEAATFSGVMPKPRSSWLGSAWNWITSIARALATIAIGVGVMFLMGALVAFSPICAAALTISVLVLLAANATVAVMNRAASGQSGGQSLGGGLADAFGVSAAVEASLDRDIATGRKLNLTADERVSRAADAFATAALVVLGGGIMRVGRAWGGKHVNCFVEGTDVVMAEFDSQAAGSQIATASPYSESDDFSGIAQSNYEVVAGTCLLVGVVGAGLSEVNSRRKRNAARRLSRVDALFANEEWDDLEIPRSAYGSFLDDANHDRDGAIGTDLYRFHDESNFMHYAA